MMKYIIQADNLNELHVKFICNNQESYYRVPLGYPGKHGLQGYNYDNLLCFEGGKVLIQPEYCYNDFDVNEDIIDISIIKNNKLFNMQYENVNWFDFHDLRKKCFATGSFDTYRHIYNNGCSLNLHFQNKSDSYPCSYNDTKENETKNTIIHKTITLFNYYENIFGKLNQKDYDIYFLDQIQNDLF